MVIVMDDIGDGTYFVEYTIRGGGPVSLSVTLHGLHVSVTSSRIPADTGYYTFIQYPDGINADEFKSSFFNAQVEGYLAPLETGTYQFEWEISDDGTIELDGYPLITLTGIATEVTKVYGSMSLQEGKQYKLTQLSGERGGTFTNILKW